MLLLKLAWCCFLHCPIITPAPSPDPVLNVPTRDESASKECYIQNKVNREMVAQSNRRSRMHTTEKAHVSAF